MISLSKKGVLSVFLLLLTTQMLPLAFAAQQGRERKVLTNEDVASPAKAPVPDETPASPAGEQGATASTAPTGQTPATKLSGTEAELKKALGFQATIKQAHEELSEKIETETDQLLKERWISMADSMSILLQHNQRTIIELEDQIKKQQEQQQQQQAQQSSP